MLIIMMPIPMYENLAFSPTPPQVTAIPILIRDKPHTTSGSVDDDVYNERNVVSII